MNPANVSATLAATLAATIASLPLASREALGEFVEKLAAVHLPGKFQLVGLEITVNNGQPVRFREISERTMPLIAAATPGTVRRTGGR